MKTCQLTVRKVATATKRGYYSDGCGLYLQVSKYGTQNWVFRYTIGGRAREMGLGSTKTVGLKLARELAREYREQLMRGNDPIELRKAKRVAAQVQEKLLPLRKRPSAT
jgi:hypothetical protein